MTNGICRNAACPNGARGTEVERYPGPGLYCPECGDELESVPAPAASVQASAPAPAPAAAPAPAPSPAPAAAAAPDPAPSPAPSAAPPPTNSVPFGGLTALQALQQFEATNAPPPPPPFSRRRSHFFINAPKRIVFASIAVLLIAAGSVAVFRPIAMGRPGPADAIRVCRSSMTERLAGDMIGAYAARSKTSKSRFDIAHNDSWCDVRFAATTIAASHGDVIGHDGIVVVVNPQNPLRRLTENEVRQIFTGEISDWSVVGGPPGPIEAVLPDDQTDEAQLLAKTLLSGSSAGREVQRVATSADVVRTVVRASGRRAIGVVAFSASAPGKVLTLGSLPPPSTISIGDARYPLSVAVTIELSDSHRPAAAGLARYARSDDAQAIALRDGFVPKKGF